MEKKSRPGSGKDDLAGTLMFQGWRGFQSHSGDALDSEAFEFLNCPCVYRFGEEWIEGKRNIRAFCPQYCAVGWRD